MSALRELDDYSTLPRFETAAMRQRRIAEAGRTAESCGQCGRPLSASETVWRLPLRVEGDLLGAAQLWVAPICSDCRPWSAAGRQPRPCSGCGRGVIADSDDYWPWAGHVFCSDRCAASWWDLQRHEGADLVQPGAGGLQAVPRSSSCLACGRPVLGRRTTCGVACRQRLYRLRKRSGPLPGGVIAAPVADSASPILTSVTSHPAEHDPSAA